MGVEIVEGRDLVVEDKKVFMRTTQGLEPVHVIYGALTTISSTQRVSQDSMLGVPGLVSAYQAGNVALANSIGTGVADDKVMYYFVPRMIKYYLDQDPIIRMSKPTRLRKKRTMIHFGQSGEARREKPPTKRAAMAC